MARVIAAVVRVVVDRMIGAKWLLTICYYHEIHRNVSHTSHENHDLPENALEPKIKRTATSMIIEYAI